MAQRNPQAVCGCCCLAVLALGVLILCSLGTVSPTQYGMRYNRFNKQIDERQIYQSGRHLIGPMSDLLLFPSTVRSLEFSNRSWANAEPLTTRTAEGLTLHLHVAFQYHLIKDEIPALYRSTNIYYESLYMKIARDILLKAAANYNAPQYWTDRKKVGQDMTLLVNQSLASSHATCTGLQLLLIELPLAYEDSIVATQVQKQDIKTKENEQQAAVIRAQIQVMVADYNKQITVIISGANANATLATKSAQAMSNQMRIHAEDEAMGEVKTQLALSPPGLVTYQRNSAYQTMPNATFLFGISNAATVLNSVAAPAPPAACAAAEKALEVR